MAAFCYKPKMETTDDGIKANKKILTEKYILVIWLKIQGRTTGSSGLRCRIPAVGSNIQSHFVAAEKQ